MSEYNPLSSKAGSAEDNRIVDRRLTVEATHPAYIAYRAEVSAAWNDFQQRLDEAKRKLDASGAAEEWRKTIEERGKRDPGLQRQR